MDKLTPKQRSYNMSRIKSKNTKPEKIVFNLLKKSGYKFIKHNKNIIGKPDIAFIKQKIVIFIDGEFWHGKKFNSWKNKLTDFWYNKINNNIKRDKKNSRLLKLNGWKVIRIWDREIIKNPETALLRIIKFIKAAV